MIAHSAEVQHQLDGFQIARGVQWELVRGIVSGDWTWADVQAKISHLTGSNVSIAPKIRNIMRGNPTLSGHTHDLALWRELDREAKAKVENRARGLGLMGEFDGIPNYYGGNVQCTVRLLYKADDQMPDVRLEPLQLTWSHHLARELGSVSVIKLLDDRDGALVKQWALRKFILCGRTYVALPPKRGKVYIIETNEDYGRIAQAWCGDEHRISYDDYVRNNNPMHLNAAQPFMKYLTRFDLYLSKSVPVLEFNPQNIFPIDDQYANGWYKDQCPPKEMIMTDGCGFLNRAAAFKISAMLGCDRTPVAYQGRIAGSKGMWILHPSDDSLEPRIWIRESQRKINLTRLLRAHRIFDLLAVSRPTSSPRLSAQAIIVLENNGVPGSVLCALQEQGCRDAVTPLMDWARPNATAYLWNVIDNVFDVTRTRLKRLAPAASRVLGFEKRSYDDGDKDKDFNAFHGTTCLDKNPYNGEPPTLAEAVMDLLQAGFDPVQSPYLSFRIHKFVKSVMDSILTRYRIPLTTSLEAFMIPDPSGQLHEGQVFYKSSQDPDGPLQEEIIGRWVLLLLIRCPGVIPSRYPMREPSDMQKVTAVNILDLAVYVDILVIPIHGSKSLASLLAGGDEVIIIRDRTIVPFFQNQRSVPIPDDFLAKNFEQQIQTVCDLGRKLEMMPLRQAQRSFQAEVLSGLEDHKIGVYSWYHDTATYETATLLDASKTGLLLRKGVVESDQLSLQHLSRPKCFDAKNGHSRQRSSHSGPFVLDSLLTAGIKIRDALQAKFETDVATHLKANDWRDGDIEEPYHRMTAVSRGDSALAVAVASDLDHLRDFVLPLRARFQSSTAEFARGKSEPRPAHQPRKSESARGAYNNHMLPIIQDFRQPVEGLRCLHLLNLDEIKASYAFTLSCKFGFTMAFQDICEIKRRAEIKRGRSNRVDVLDQARDMSELAQQLFYHPRDN
ncbi:RNA dependent RNA polymerase-domain-containing protein [Mycena vitilis]|nr:RNA dependent RNA polymerase-domain-containing protein [Mycena vitilis]